MAITVRERARSRKNTLAADAATKTVELVALGSTDENLILVEVLILTPLYAFGPGPAGVPVPLRRNKVTCDPAGAGLWHVDVEYEFAGQQAESSSPDTQDSDQVGIEWAFDGTGGTAHVTQSVKTRFNRQRGDPVGTTTTPGTAPDFQRAVGVTYDRVEGCDVIAPRMELTATLNYLGLTWGQVRTWGRLAGKTNKERWKGFEAGELLYAGPAGGIQPGQLAKATHKFAFGEILLAGDPALVIDPRVAPNGIVLPEKKPFDFLWCGYRPEEAAGAVVIRPTAAYVEQVYREGDFTTLGLGS